MNKKTKIRFVCQTLLYLREYTHTSPQRLVFKFMTSFTRLDVQINVTGVVQN